MEGLQPGDSCLECLGRGFDHKLRYFYLNLDEELLKCESNCCVWPHIDDDEDIQPVTQSTSDDDDEFIKQLVDMKTNNNFAVETQLNCDSSANNNTGYNIDDIFLDPMNWESTQQQQQQLCSPKALLSETSTDLDQPASGAAACSMPDISSGSTEKSEENVAVDEYSQIVSTIGFSAKAGDIAYTISIPQPVHQQHESAPVPKVPSFDKLPKASPFQLLPAKASTLVFEQQQSQPTAATTAAIEPLQGTASRFLDELSRSQLHRGTANVPRGRRPMQRERIPAANGRLHTFTIKQMLEQIPAVGCHRSKSGIESEPEPQPRREQNAKQEHTK